MISYRGKNKFVVTNGLYTKMEQTKRTHEICLILVDLNPRSYSRLGDMVVNFYHI